MTSARSHGRCWSRNGTSSASPLVPECDVAAVSCDARRPGVVGIRLHPHERVHEVRELSTSGTDALQNDDLAASADLDRTPTPTLDPSRRSVGDRLASADGLEHAVPHEADPAEERVMPSDVVCVDDRNASDDFSHTRRESRLARPAATIDGDDRGPLGDGARRCQPEQHPADVPDWARRPRPCCGLTSERPDSGPSLGHDV
jgi:hypothetical protein